jgi:hypothetical protein
MLMLRETGPSPIPLSVLQIQVLTEGVYADAARGRT